MNDRATPQPVSPSQLVLVVDDDDSNRLLAQTILTTGGYACIAAANGLEAIEAFRETPPALVLLDVLMPGMDGFETLGHLRALPGGSAASIIVVTGLNDLTSVQKALAAGADDFVTKPYNRVELLIRIRSILRRQAPPNGEMDPIASLVVHDLKHPLTAIYFNAGLLRRDPSLSTMAREKIGRILRASERLDSMIASILDVTRSDERGLELDRSEFEIGVLLDEVARAQEVHAAANEQKIEVVDRCSDERLLADRDILRRILENLLDNAQRYAPPRTAIRVEADETRGVVELRVRDDGPGIPFEARGQIFERHFRIGRAAGRTGHGLGLAFVRLAVEAHGGTVAVEDMPSNGACFCVRIPRGTTRSAS